MQKQKYYEGGGLKYVALWPNIQNRGMVLMYVMVMVLIYMQRQKYYEGGGLIWPNIQNRGKHRPLRLMPLLSQIHGPRENTAH